MPKGVHRYIIEISKETGKLNHHAYKEGDRQWSILFGFGKEEHYDLGGRGIYTYTINIAEHNGKVDRIKIINMDLFHDLEFSYTIETESVFTKPLEAANNWNRTEVTLAFTIAIGAIGLAAALGGTLLDRIGPKIVATIGSGLFGIGTILTGISVDSKSLLLLYITYGVLGGVGIGLGYITPISTLVKWFPDKRGLITGLAIMGFGVGAFFMSTFTPALIDTIGISSTFYILGIIFLILTISGKFKEEDKNLTIVKKVPITVLLLFRRKVNGYRQKKSRIFRG